MLTKTPITSPKAPQPVGVYSSAIEVRGADRLLFMSGFTSRAPDGTVIGDNDITLQTETVLKNLSAVIEAAGGALSDIVKITVFVRDLEQFRQVQDVRKRYFTPPYPASTMIQISRLVDPRCLIEIDAIAALPDRPA